MWPMVELPLILQVIHPIIRPVTGSVRFEEAVLICRLSGILQNETWNLLGKVSLKNIRRRLVKWKQRKKTNKEKGRRLWSFAVACLLYRTNFVNEIHCSQIMFQHLFSLTAYRKWKRKQQISLHCIIAAPQRRQYAKFYMKVVSKMSLSFMSLSFMSLSWANAASHSPSQLLAKSVTSSAQVCLCCISSVIVSFFCLQHTLTCLIGSHWP